MTFACGDKYVGQWKDDKIDGQGSIIFIHGDKYVGQWKDEQKAWARHLYIFRWHKMGRGV